MSQHFVRRNRHLFHIERCKSVVRNSNKEAAETTKAIVLDKVLEIGGLKHESNWIVGNCRYNILLGMYRHVDVNPIIDHCTRSFTCEENSIPVQDASTP